MNARLKRFLSLSMAMTLVMTSSLTVYAAENSIMTTLYADDEAGFPEEILTVDESQEAAEIISDGADGETTGCVTEDNFDTEQEYEETWSSADEATDESAFSWDGKEITGYTGSNTELIIPKKATSIKKEAFQDKAIRTLRFEKDSKCTEIGDFAFNNCGITEVELPESLTKIGMGAFRNNSLTQITLPRKLQEIVYNPVYFQPFENTAFYGNPGLTSVTINSVGLKEGGKAFRNVPIREILFGNGVTDVPENLFYQSDLSGIELVLPKQITEIGAYAFYDSGLRSLSFQGDGLKKIGDYALYLSAFSEIDFPSSLREIGRNAFAGSALTTLTLPEGLEKVADGAFMDCEQLKTLNYNCTNITDSCQYAFTGDKFSAVNIGNSVKCLPKCFLYGVDLSEVRLTVPESVQTISDMAFYGSKLSEITFNGNGLLAVGKAAFRSCPIAELALPHSVRSMDSEAFLANTVLVKTVLPKALEKAKHDIFSSNSALEAVAIYKTTAFYEKGFLYVNPFEGCSTRLLTIYGYPGSDAEKYAIEEGYTFKSINDWEGGNPYGDNGSGDNGDEPETVVGAGESGMDQAVKLEVKDMVKKTWSAQMVKGQKYTFGNGKWVSYNGSAVKAVNIAAKTGVATAKSAGDSTLEDTVSGKKIYVKVFAPFISDSKKLTLVAGEEPTEISLAGMNGCDMTVTWLTSNCEVASVEGKGSMARVTPLGKGSAKISAWVGGRSWSWKVSVKDTYAVPRLSGKEYESITVAALQTVNLKFANGFKAKSAEWKDADGNPLGESSAVNVVKGKLIANQVTDDYEITGNDGSMTITLSVTVKAVPTKSVLYMNKGTAKTLKNTPVKGKGMKWTSDGNDVFRLTGEDNASVKINAVTAGSDFLTCLYRGVELVTIVHVEDPTPENSTIQLKEGETGEMGLYSVTQEGIYKSSKPAVAFVDEKGTIYARKKGNASISAKVNGKTVKVQVIVK